MGDREIWHCMVTKSVNPFGAKKKHSRNMNLSCNKQSVCLLGNTWSLSTLREKIKKTLEQLMKSAHTEKQGKPVNQKMGYSVMKLSKLQEKSVFNIVKQ